MPIGKIVTWLMICGIAIAMAGCNAGRSPGEAELRRGLSGEPESLDPQRAQSTVAGKVIGDLYEGLVTLGAHGEPQPGIAKTWSVSDDGLHYTFLLRDALKWSNGEPLSANDVVQSFQRLLGPRTTSVYASMFASIDNAEAATSGIVSADWIGVSAKDAQTIEIHLKRRDPALIAKLAHFSAVIVPAAAAGSDEGLVSNGAYTLVRHKVGAAIELARNPYFHSVDQVFFEHVRYIPTEIEAAELNRFRAGELDITSRVPAADIKRLQKDYGGQLRIAPYLGVYYIGINIREKPLSVSPQLREALSLVIDRDTIASAVTGRGELPAWGWVPPGIRNYKPARFSYADWSAENRLARAQKLYAEAGYDDDSQPEIVLRYNSSDENRRIAVALQAMWRDAFGFDATLLNQEFKIMLAQNRAGTTAGLFRGSWIADYPDAMNFLSIVQSSDPRNYSGVADPEIDVALQIARTSDSEEARLAALQKAEELLLRKHALLPIYFYVSKHLVAERIAGWKDNSLDFHYSRYLKAKPGE